MRRNGEVLGSFKQYPSATPSGEPAVIGRSVSVRGDVTGAEDLLIQGRVDGSVGLEQYAVTVGPEGHVKGDITARVVSVGGKVEGDLIGDEEVVLRASARVEGNIVASSLIVEEGARFLGKVDMSKGRAVGRALTAA